MKTIHHHSIKLRRVRSVVFFQPKPVALLVAALAISGLSENAYADDYFDPSLLAFGSEQGAQPVDLSQFEKSGGEVPGRYMVDIYINGGVYTTRQVTFNKDKAGHLVPDLTLNDLIRMGVNINGIKGLQNQPRNKPVGYIADLIPDASARLDMNALRLNVSVPQANMRADAQDMVDPSQWQEGIPAFLLDYSLSGNVNSSDGQEGMGGTKSTSAFASFMTGFNLGAWRFRSHESWSYSREQQSEYDSQADAMKKAATQQSQWTFLDRYVQRDIAPLRSELTMGDTSLGSTASQVFDGFSFRGITLASDSSMIPSRLNGYAPVIAGVAKSNAQITVRQNGNVIYQTYVSPGPFRITDLNGIGNGGDLQVTVTEADGSKHGFTQAAASLAVMQRPGSFQYEVAAGRYRQGGYTNGAREPLFATAALIYGLPHGITAYGGLLSGQGYQAGALGAGISLGVLGAISADVTRSHARLPGMHEYANGASYRLRYAKELLATGTSVDMMAYRYSTRQFYSFQDANTQGFSVRDGIVPWIQERRRSSMQVQVNQRITDSISLFLAGSRDNYWNSTRVNTTLSTGLSGSVGNVGWGINYSVDRMRGDGSWPENRQVSLSFSVPMSIFSSSAALNSAQASWSITHDNQGRTSNTTAVSGALGDSGSWNAAQSWGNQGQTSNSSVGGGYNGSMGSINLGYNQGGGQRDISYGLHGGILAHQYGITLAPGLGQSTVLIRASGAPDVSVMGGNNVSTNRWGYAVSSGVTPYRRNVISLDPTTLPVGADLTDTSQDVYPTKGAVVLANYRVRIGQQVLMTLKQRDGKPVPFGAMASPAGEKDTKDSYAAIVGDGGQVYLSGMPEKGSLLVKWGTGSAGQCTVHYEIGGPAREEKSKEGQPTFAPLKQKSETCD